MDLPEDWMAELLITDSKVRSDGKVYECRRGSFINEFNLNEAFVECFIVSCSFFTVEWWVIEVFWLQKFIDVILLNIVFQF